MKHFGVLTCSLRDYEKGRRTNETDNDRIEVVRKNGHLWVHHNQRTSKPQKVWGAKEARQTVMNPNES